MMTSEYQARVERLTPEEKRELDLLLGLVSNVWAPDPRNAPQQAAYACTADVVGYGGAAGGGKTDLAIGKALTRHQVVQIFRRQGTELGALIDRAIEIVGHDNGLSRAHPATWREPLPGVKVIEFGSVPNLGDERKHQGRPKDLLAIDEAANFLESQVRFLMGWVRSVDPNQLCQTLLLFNPPTSAEGQWIIGFFAPWLDDMHPCPAAPGEIRYFAWVVDREVEMPDGRPFVIKGRSQFVYDFDPSAHKPEEIIKPRSRTFFPARVGDNQYLAGTNYMATLQALPEPLRSQMLTGDFKAGMEDDIWQVIPTAWVDAAMKRWKKPDIKPPMDSVGVDVARGGKDSTVIARRHAHWYDELIAYPGTQTPDGPTGAGLVVVALRDSAPIHVDVIGVGASVYDKLNELKLQVHAINVSETSHATDKSGTLRFFNQRSEHVWKMREDLDPANNRGIALPPDARLRADLCAYKWTLAGKVIKVESREEILARIGRSPDYASAVLLARLETPRMADLRRTDALDQQRGHDPYAILGPGTHVEQAAEHDPYRNL